MNKYRNLLLNTALFAVNSIATKLISFVLVPLYTTYLSAGEYGITDMSLTVISLVTPLATLSVADAAVRYIVRDRGRAGEYAALSFSVVLLSAVGVGLLAPFLDLGVFGGLGGHKLLFVLAYLSSALLGLCGNIARGVGKVRLITICAAVSAFVTLVSSYALIGVIGMGVAGYFVSVSLGPAVAVILYFTIGGFARLVVGGVASIVRSGSMLSELAELCRPMLLYALPLIPNALFWWAQTSISRFFITGMLGIAASGMYAAASKVPNLLNTMYSIFQQAWQLSAFQESEGNELAQFFGSVFRFLQAGITTLCAILSLTSPLLADILLRGETFVSWPMISILLIANLMNVFNAFFGTVYTATMHTSYIMKTTVVGAVVCILLTPILLQLMGLFGACVASAASQGVVLLLRAIDSQKYVSFDAGWRVLAPTILFLVVQACATALQLDHWIVISAACSAAVFLLQGIHIAVHLLRKGRCQNH